MLAVLVGREPGISSPGLFHGAFCSAHDKRWLPPKDDSAESKVEPQGFHYLPMELDILNRV